MIITTLVRHDVNQNIESIFDKKKMCFFLKLNVATASQLLVIFALENSYLYIFASFFLFDEEKLQPLSRLLTACLVHKFCQII